MSFPVEAFWKLVVEGQLLSLEDCHRYHSAWIAQNPQGGDAQQLAEWLFSQNAISRYQASILLAGRAGPFVYGDYKIYDRIESGRLKGIFRALHTPTMHMVCLQFLTAEQAASPENVNWLSQQAAYVSRSSAGYPHLLRCYQLVDLGPYKFFVLEDLQGKRVERLLQQKGAMPQSEACRIARQAALGLARLHAAQQAHGDIRPSNLWVDASGTIKLLQFPLSRDPLAAPLDWRRLAAESAEKAPPEADYVAPELIAGGQPDARSDLYQLGCSLYAMLTNRVPFPAKTLREKLEGHLKGQPTPIEQLNPAIAPALGKVVMYMMAKKPDMRYQQAATVIEKLLPFMSAGDAQSQPVPPTPQSQAYDAWVLERLSTSVSSAPQPAAAQPAMAPQAAMPAAAAMPQPAMMPQAAMMAQPGMMQPGMMAQPGMMQPGMMGQPVMPAGQPYAAQPYAAQPYGAQPYQAAAAQPANPYVASAPAYSPPAPPVPEPELAPAEPARTAAPPRPGAAPPRTASFAEESPRVRKRSSNSMFLIGLIAAALVLPVGYFVWDNYGSSTAAVPAPGVNPKPGPKPTGKPAGTGTRPAAGPKATAAPAVVAEAAPQGNVVAVRDTMTAHGEAIWDSPTAGKPLALNYLPRGASMIIAFRPAEIVQHEEAKRLYQENADPERKIRVLGAAAEWFENTLPQWSGSSLENIDQVLVGMLDGGDTVRAGYVIRLKSAVDEATIAQAWGPAAPEELEGVKLYVRDGLACYLPAAAGGKAIVIAPREEMSDLLMLQGAPPQLSRRELDFMVQTTDSDRHVNILFSPHYLESGGRSITAGSLGPLVGPLNWLFTGVGLAPLSAAAADGSASSASMSSDDAEPPKGVLFSAHLTGTGGSESFFWELRLYNGNASAVMESGVAPLASRVKEIPDRMDAFIDSVPLLPYGRKILRNFPRMVEFFVNNVRAAVADRQFVLRGYLPAIAAHNFALGTYLCVLESSGGVVMVANTGGGGNPGQPKKQTALDILRTKKMALAFDRNDLNKVLDIVANEIGVPIEMHGDDFRTAGITKNQSMGLAEPEQTVDKLLQVILKKANLDGQLIYMVKAEPDGSEKILILTRKGAADRKEPLLPEFAEAPPAKK